MVRFRSLLVGGGGFEPKKTIFLLIKFEYLCKILLKNSQNIHKIKFYARLILHPIAHPDLSVLISSQRRFI